MSKKSDLVIRWILLIVGITSTVIGYLIDDDLAIIQGLLFMVISKLVDMSGDIENLKARKR